MSAEHFNQRLADVLNADPDAYRLLISDEPTRAMWELVESLALDADPDHPDAALWLFQDLSHRSEQQDERWLAGLRDAARRLAAQHSLGTAASLADRLLWRVYADPVLYDLVAAVEPGAGLRDLIESMALEGDADDIEAMVQLLRQLCAS